MLPTALYVVGVAVLVTVRAGFWVAAAVAWVAAVEIVAAPYLAWPVAVFTMEPASRSAWVTAWLAVQVTVALGARLAVGGQVTVTLLSVTANGATRVTLLVFLST